MQSINVYFNLHERIFSLKQGGRVIGHAPQVHISCPTFVVNERGRQRVIDEQRKNVHAYVRGYSPNVHTLPYTPIKQRKNEIEVKYNPYTARFFYEIATDERHEVLAADEARMIVYDRRHPRIFVLNPVLTEEVVKGVPVVVRNDPFDSNYYVAEWK